MHLVPVMQLGIEIAGTRCHQILRKQSHLPECRLSKTLSNAKIRHDVVEIANKNVLAKMHLVPVMQLGIEIDITRCHQILRKQSHLPECRLSKTLSNSKIRHEVLEIANKM